MLLLVADYDSTDCEVTFDGQDRTLAVGPSNANKCGGQLFPWRLKVDDGQRVNITLVQFALNNDDDDDDDDDDHGDDYSTLSASSHDAIDDPYDVAEITANGELPTVNDSWFYICRFPDVCLG